MGLKQLLLIEKILRRSVLYMMSNILYKRTIDVSDNISIYIPNVGEVVDNEDNYYSALTILTAMPIDMMVFLDEVGIDFTEINEYELFLLMSAELKNIDTSLIFGNLDFSKFEVSVNRQNGNIILHDFVNDVTIDRAIYNKIAGVLRKIHHLEKNRRKPANKEAKEYMLERAKKKAKRNANRNQESQLESLIIALVNTEQFKYNFESVRDLSIYQFNESVKQIIKKVDYENIMYGIYAGTVNAKELSQNDLNWLVHK